MAQKRLDVVRQIKTILRLHCAGGIDSCRVLARAVGAGKSAVADCLRRARAAGLTSWAAIELLDEEALAARLYPVARSAPRVRKDRPLPDWHRIREELSRRDH